MHRAVFRAEDMHRAVFYPLPVLKWLENSELQAYVPNSSIVFLLNYYKLSRDLGQVVYICCKCLLRFMTN